MYTTSYNLFYNQLHQEITTVNTTTYFSVQADFAGHRQEDIAMLRIQSANSKFLQSLPQEGPEYWHKELFQLSHLTPSDFCN